MKKVRTFRKRMSRKPISILALIIAVAFCVASLIFQWQSAEQKVRDKIRAYDMEVEQCTRMLKHESLVPIVGGGKLDLKRLWGIGVHITVSNGRCGVDLSENLFWWSGSELIVNDQFGFDPKQVTGWIPYKVTISFSEAHPISNIGSNGAGGQNYDRSKTHILLENYPGLELRLPTLPPSKNNVSDILNFYFTKQQPVGDPNHFISCRFPEGSIAERSTSREKLATLLEEDVRYLEKIEFSNEKLLCEVDGKNFDLGERMGGRVFFDSASLKQAPKALPAIRKYIIDSVKKD